MQVKLIEIGQLFVVRFWHLCRTRPQSRLLTLFLIMLWGLSLGQLGIVPRMAFGSKAVQQAENFRSGSVGRFDQWIQSASQKSLAGLLANIAPHGGVRGSVAASPSQQNPDYFFHWVRDAALVQDFLVSLLIKSPSQADWSQIAQLLTDFVSFSQYNQQTSNPSGGPYDLGLGEPKFKMDGSPFWGPWGRPQNDGPALRAITLSRFAFELIRKGHLAYVKQSLYDGKQPSRSAIKADLEFVSHHWREASFDLWEEVKGTHFYTRMVQRKALVVGSVLARWMGDSFAADWYERQALLISKDLERFWNSKRGYIEATLDRVEGIDYKHSGLDIAVILGVLHGDLSSVESLMLQKRNWNFSIDDPRVSETASRITGVFHAIYPINSSATFHRPDGIADAIGRYPEDRYDGYHSSGLGNPWFLCTNAMAEFNFKLKRCSLGDAYLRRTAFHMPADFSMSEQLNRFNGFATGARDLTWSYASLLSSFLSRSEMNCPSSK